MGDVLELPRSLKRPILFPWLDYDHENLDEIISNLAKENIKQTFHETAYPVFNTLLAKKMRLIILNISLLPGEYGNNPALERVIEEMSYPEENWKIGKYIIQELRKDYSANKNTVIFATAYNNNLFDSYYKKNVDAKDMAITAGATAFYNLIDEHKSLTADIISYLKKK